jgi:beta-lactamase regulating signal transducer with metallopeptidase domain
MAVLFPMAAIVTQCLLWLSSSAADLLSAVLRTTAQQAASMAVTAVWQSALIAGVLAILLRLAPPTSAAHRFQVWAAAFAVLVSLPLFSPMSHSASNLAVVAGASAANGNAWLSKPWIHLEARWSLWIGALWAAVSLWRAGDLILHSVRLRGLWKHVVRVDVAGSLHAMLVRDTAAWYRGPVEVCTTTAIERPSVIGFFKPRILIPDWLFARLTTGELEQIVLHEAEHLRRRDDWTNLLQKICLVLFPLNPALYWIERRLCREREMACDEGVIEVTRAPRAYAACLASLAERGLQHRAEALSLGAWHRRPELVDRVHSILRSKHVLSKQGSRALLGALGCGLVVGSIALAHCPQLVAFVPSPNRDSAEGARLASLGRARAAGAAIVSVENAAAGDGSQTIRATKIKGELAASGAAQSDEASVPAEFAGAKREATLSRKVSPHASDSDADYAVLLTTENPSVRTLPAHEEQWVVLTAWEQIPTSAAVASSPLTADYETGAAATNAESSAARSSGQAGIQPAGQITVTQLIFRIVSTNRVRASSMAGSEAGSASGTRAAASTQSGWFVLQL